MTKRASLDTEQFRVELPSQPRDPLESVIPTTPPAPQLAKQPVIPNSISTVHTAMSGEGAELEPENERTNVLPFQRNEEKPPRLVIRHTFDVYQDQLIRLQKLQIDAMSRGRRKPKL